MGLRATFWAYSALIMFCIMGITVRQLSYDLPILQIIFLRCLLGALILLSFIIVTRKFSLLQIQDSYLHIRRNIMHFLGQIGWCYSISIMPLGVVFALEFTVPFWCIIIAYILFRTPINIHQINTIFISICGVLLIVWDQLSSVNYSVFIMLATAIAYAFTHVTTKQLLKKNTAITIILYMNVIQVFFAGIFAYSDWQPITGGYEWLVLLAIAGVSSHLCLTKAMQYADVSKVMITDTLRLPIITILGYLLYNETISVMFLIGASLIIFANIYNVKPTAKSNAKKTAKPTAKSVT